MSSHACLTQCLLHVLLNVSYFVKSASCFLVLLASSLSSLYSLSSLSLLSRSKSRLKSGLYPESFAVSRGVRPSSVSFGAWASDPDYDERSKETKGVIWGALNTESGLVRGATPRGARSEATRRQFCMSSSSYDSAQLTSSSMTLASFSPYMQA